MHYKLFTAKKGNIEPGQRPPCRDCLRLHASRANYQAAIWQRALDANIPSPIDCDGWVLDENGQLQVNWMTGSPAPDVVLQFMSCKCKLKCQLPDCQCITNGLKCTDACTCSLSACENMRNEEDLMYDKEHTDSETSDKDNSSDDEY